MHYLQPKYQKNVKNEMPHPAKALLKAGSCYVGIHERYHIEWDKELILFGNSNSICTQLKLTRILSQYEKKIEPMWASISFHWLILRQSFTVSHMSISSCHRRDNFLISDRLITSLFLGTMSKFLFYNCSHCMMSRSIITSFSLLEKFELYSKLFMSRWPHKTFAPGGD